MKIKTVRVIARGEVQGVFFRATTKSFAEKLKLVGSVKNLSNGTVELIVHGEERKIKELLTQLQNSFNLQASQIKVSPYELTDPTASFQIIHN